MSSLRKYLTTTMAVVLVFAVNLVAYAESNSLERAKGVILFIGDGTGINQVSSADIYAKRVLGRDLMINSIRTSGLTTTHAANSEVTDSAAAATALYSGYKTNTGQLNILPDGSKASNVAQAAKKAGLSVGIVSTARLTDATPAAVYSSSPRRDCEAYIAEQLPDFAPDAILGGGWAYFVPSSQNGSKRKDQKDIIQAMKISGYDFVENRSQLRAVNPKTVDKLFGLFAKGNMAYAVDRENNPVFSNQPSLAEMTQTALSIVGKNPKGFFIMIEGGRIDHACHTHDMKTMISDILDFDEAVEVGLKFQESHPDVLVIVTADHETGGLTQMEGDQFTIDPVPLEPIKRSLFYLEDKIKKDPSQQDAILKSAGLKLTEEEAELLRNYQTKSVEDKASGSGDPATRGKLSKSGTLNALSMITSQAAKVKWTTFGHTGKAVATKAVGPGQEQFSGTYDNTDIAKKIAELLNVSISKPSLADDLSASVEQSRSATTCP